MYMVINNLNLNKVMPEYGEKDFLSIMEQVIVFDWCILKKKKMMYNYYIAKAFNTGGSFACNKISSSETNKW